LHGWLGLRWLGEAALTDGWGPADGTWLAVVDCPFDGA
jgi:hypothetical protein